MDLGRAGFGEAEMATCGAARVALWAANEQTSLSSLKEHSIYAYMHICIYNIHIIHMINSIIIINYKL